MSINNAVSERGITLIGMPGVGKSTIGVLLAKSLHLPFLDTDVWIQAQEKQSLEGLLTCLGKKAFNHLEERYLRAIPLEPRVVATGGSAVYCHAGMEHLKRFTAVVHLFLPMEELAKRLTNWNSRGIVKEKGETLADLFEVRLPLYQKYADITIPCAGLNHEQVLLRILTALMGNNGELPRIK